MRTVFAVLLLGTILAASGCVADPTATSEKKSLGGNSARTPVSLPDNITKLEPIAPQVLVSRQGDRMAEFMIARNLVDPNHLILAAHDYDHLGTGTMSCVLYVSRDGGATWKQSNPIPGLNRPHLQFDGWVSFDANGVAHFICLDYANGPSTVPYYSYSTDGGMTWSQATVIQPLIPSGSCDKTSLHAARDGRVYAMCSNRITFSDDFGKTWAPQKNPGGSNPNGFAEDKDGGIYVWVRGQGGGRVARSFDRGETWNATVVGPFQIPPGYNDQNRWVDQRPWTTLPSIWISPLTDHVFVAQQSWNTATSVYDTHVYISKDRGATYERVTTPAFKSSTCSPCSVTKPSITVDDRGRVGLLVQLTNEGGHIKEVMFSASADEGQTWVEPIVLSKTASPNGWANPRAFTPNVAGAATLATHIASNPTDVPQVVIGVALTTAVQELQMRWNGEYWGINSSPAGFVTSWIDHSNGGVPQVYARLVKAE